MKHLFSILTLLVISAAASYGLTLKPTTLPMRLERAERVVVGTLSTTGGAWTIDVNRVLKGPAEPTTIKL